MPVSVILTPTMKTTHSPIHYDIDASDVHAHLYRVTLTIAHPAAQQRVSLPVWIPGSYMVREFSKHLQKLVAKQNGKTVATQQLDKCSWQINNAEGKALTLQYEVYAFDNSVRTAWLDTQRGFFNGTSLCLRVQGQDDVPHSLHINAIKSIAAHALITGATAQNVDKKGFGLYTFTNYDELADCPFEIGSFWRGDFTVRGALHSFAVAGALPSFDGARLIADTQKIVETEMAFWHLAKGKPPFNRYVFMLSAVDDGYGGLEHRNSTALICNRRDLPRMGQDKASDGYNTLLGLISHEYFHTWNVKRLRPAEFARYEYQSEQYTQLLWFFEGFTSYYDDVLLRRAGLIDNAQYLKLLNKTINQVMQSPGAQVQSVAQASFDAWIKYYRQDENTANATVSYYTKGSLVALCFDLTLGREGHTTLDAVMRELFKRCKAGPMTEQNFAEVLRDLGGRAFTKELAAWVHGTRDLPLKDLLTHHGVTVVEDKAQLAQRLGLRVAESGGTVQVKVVLRGSVAERAGFCPGDEWLFVNDWRLGKLDDMPLYAGKAKTVNALVSRDKRLVTLKLALPKDATTWALRVRDADAVSKWLAG
jgi:predicted metalloprotease with PDZ domain